MFFLAWRFPFPGAKKIWFRITLVAVLAILALVGSDWILYESPGSDTKTTYGLQQAIFRLIASTDYPFVAVFFGSLIALGTSSIASRK